MVWSQGRSCFGAYVAHCQNADLRKPWLALEKDQHRENVGPWVEKLLGELKGKGVQVDMVDRAQFVTATKPVYDKWLSGPVGDFAKRVVEASK